MAASFRDKCCYSVCYAPVVLYNVYYYINAITVHVVVHSSPFVATDQGAIQRTKETGQRLRQENRQTKTWFLVIQKQMRANLLLESDP